MMRSLLLRMLTMMRSRVQGMRVLCTHTRALSQVPHPVFARGVSTVTRDDVVRAISVDLFSDNVCIDDNVDNNDDCDDDRAIASDPIDSASASYTQHGHAEHAATHSRTQKTSAYEVFKAITDGAYLSTKRRSVAVRSVL
jgi:hypothetical protein